MEPHPENVTGEVVRRHSFEHQVNWSHVVVGAAVLFVAFHTVKLLDSGESDFESDPESDQRLIT